MGLFRSKAKTQDLYSRRAEASARAAESDDAAKAALVKKMKRPGGAGRLTRAELRLAKRMGLGEADG